MEDKEKQVRAVFDMLSSVSSRHGDDRLSKLFQALKVYKGEGPIAGTETGDIIKEIGGIDPELETKVGEILGVSTALVCMKTNPELDAEATIHELGQKAFSSAQSSLAKMGKEGSFEGKTEVVVPLCAAIQATMITAMVICFGAGIILEKKGGGKN